MSVGDEGLKQAIEQLYNRCDSLQAELTSTRHELERQIGDERSDRERADDSIRDDLSSLQHRVDFL